MSGEAYSMTCRRAAEYGKVEVDDRESLTVEPASGTTGLDVDDSLDGGCLHSEVLGNLDEVLLLKRTGVVERVGAWYERCVQGVVFDNNKGTTERIDVDVLTVVHIYCIAPQTSYISGGHKDRRNHEGQCQCKRPHAVIRAWRLSRGCV